MFNRAEDEFQYNKASKIALAETSFDLRKWVTNNEKIQNFIGN